MPILHILCIGDSYTKGESVVWERNFPNQLTDGLRSAGHTIDSASPRVIAQTGWRTDELIAAIAAASDVNDRAYDLVTLCIGVNNQYQNADFEVYKTELRRLMETAVARAGHRPERAIVLSIPDWAFTPFGRQRDNPQAISDQIDQYNAYKKALAQELGLRWVDVTETSRQGLAQPDLVAGDELHPSDLQYAAWTRLLLTEALSALG